MGIKGSKKKSKNFPPLRVLIFGISGSGKTTFSKQMKYIHGGFSSDELSNYKQMVHFGVLHGLHELVDQCEKLGESIESENRKFCRLLSDQILNDNFSFDKASGEKAKSLWNDDSIQRIWHQTAQYNSNLNFLEFFLNDFDRVYAKDYLPTKQDVLKIRFRTTGEQMTTFAKDNYQWQLVDVGGQKIERKKWDNFINDGVFSAVIYFVAMDEYNVLSTEEDSKTKLQVSQDTFKTLIDNLPANSPIIVFFNKMDLFKSKITESTHFADFQKKYPNYNGKKSDVNECAEYLKNKFLDGLDNENDIQTHNTCALDTEAMTAVFEAVKNHLYLGRLTANRVNLV